MELAELSALVDTFNQARNKRLAADKEARALKSVETKLKEQILHVMIDQDCGFAAGMDVRVKLQTKSKPQATDWSLVYDYMIQNDAMDLVQKRLTESAVNARLEDGIEIPGIEFYEVNDLSVAKL